MFCKRFAVLIFIPVKNFRDERNENWTGAHFLSKRIVIKIRETSLEQNFWDLVELSKVTIS